MPGRSLLRALGSICAAVLTAGTAHAASPPVVVGPFEIQGFPARIGAGGFPNTTMNPFQTTTITRFRVTHRGKRLTVADGQATTDEFADVMILTGAPRPALLVAWAGVYLLHEDDGRLKVEILARAESDTPLWQWLDSENGQPGREYSVTIRSAGSEPMKDRRGTLLLVNRMRVLDVGSLRHSPVVLRSTPGVDGGYSAGNEHARVFSPGRTQFVVVGQRTVNAVTEYALIVADLTNGRAYDVPFDRTALRFASITDATPLWINHYFEWTREAGGGERFRPRTGVKPMPWLGRFDRSGPRVEYRLLPTRPGMRDAFVSFLRSAYGAQDSTAWTGSPPGQQSKVLAIDGQVLWVDYRANDRTMSLYAELGSGPLPTAAYALIEKIGAKFNEALARGQHQDLFEEISAGR